MPRKDAKPEGDVVDLALNVGPQRVKTSISIDPLVWRQFQVACRQVGHSTCGVLEPFMYAFSGTVNRGDYHDPRPLTVNLNVYRQVQRVHRRGVERVYEEAPRDLGDAGTCFMCGHEAVYYGTLSRTSPKVPAYICGDCRGLLGDRRGFRVLKIKNVGRSWVGPGDPSL